MPLPARAAGNAVTFHPAPAHAAGGRRASVPQDCRPPGHRPRGWGRRPPPARHGGRSRKQRKAPPTQGRAAARVGLARRPLPAGVVAHGVGTAARRPPGPSPAWGWDCRPSPAGPDCRRRKRREASPAVRRGRCPRGWDCRPSPAGPDCRRRKRREAPPTQSRAVACVGLARRPAPHGAPRTTADMQNPGNAVTFYPVDTSYMQV